MVKSDMERITKRETAFMRVFVFALYIYEVLILIWTIHFYYT